MNDLRPGVLFDVDGTLLDTNYLHVLTWWQALNEAGHREVPMRAVHRAIGIASEGLTEHLLREVDEVAVESHSARFRDLLGQVRSFPRAADLVAACAGRGLTPVLATSGKEKDLEWMLPAIGAGESFAGVTTSSDVEDGKPQPDLLSGAMRRNRLDPDRTAAVGDTVWDVRAAARAGIPCIALLSGGISEAELREEGAVEVYDDPADLLARLDKSLVARLTG
jgi:phosphoglycolate phosphatase-like HAD superfamily hydrolase